MSHEITFGNKSDVNPVKVCIYKATDTVDIVPVEGGVVNVPAGSSRKWSPAAGETADRFHVKFYQPGLVDKFLAGVNPVTWGATVTILGNASSGYHLNVT